jgi:uncharacterized protein with GYD domain
MQTYIFLTTWTDQGIRDSGNSVERATAAVDAMERLGVKIFETYWTVGIYDLVLVAECPDQETAHAVSLKLSSRGNIRATALRAFDPEEMRGILEKVAASE